MGLPAEDLKFIFDTRVLRPGDILLMNTYEERLRNKLGCKYEHAAIYLGDAHIMEANGLFVKMEHIYSRAFKAKDHACVLRPKSISPVTLNHIVINAHSQVGREYSTRQFVYVRDRKNSNAKDSTNRTFCSRFVAQTYASENVMIVPNADFCEPDDFLHSPLLSQVEHAIMPVDDELKKVVESQQHFRELDETDSPNAELYSSLTALYNNDGVTTVDIQDLNQMLMTSFRYPDKDDEAIAIIQTSRMFKHIDEVKRHTPWMLDDEAFFNHYPDVDDALHFLYSHIGHYDNTIILRYQQLHVQIISLEYYFKHSKLLSFLKDTIGKMVAEAIEIRKQLEHLYEQVMQRYPEEYASFVKRYGSCNGYKYVPPILDIGFILHDIMKASNSSGH